MCGRAAQTHHAAMAAAQSLGVAAAPQHQFNDNDNADQSQPRQEPRPDTASAGHPSSSFSSMQNRDRDRDNYNMSPGMDALVIWKNNNRNNRTTSTTTSSRSQLVLSTGRKVWGLVPRGGTATNPLPQGMNQHFANSMFNARSDTLFEKVTYARLANAGKTCVVAVDGYYEWKQDKEKQPYYIYRNKNNETNNSKPYLLIAGLWTSVPTGRTTSTNDPDEDHANTTAATCSSTTLDTFNMLTTDACESLQWLHHRMPLVIWNQDLALQWLSAPSERILRQLEADAADNSGNMFQWHAVTKAMGSLKYRSSNAMQPLPKYKTVTSLFAAAASASAAAAATATNTSKEENDGSAASPGIVGTGTISSFKTTTPTQASISKRSPTSPLVPSSSSKKKKTSSPTRKQNNKGTIDSFFARKKDA